MTYISGLTVISTWSFSEILSVWESQEAVQCILYVKELELNYKQHAPITLLLKNSEITLQITNKPARLRLWKKKGFVADHCDTMVLSSRDISQVAVQCWSYVYTWKIAVWYYNLSSRSHKDPVKICRFFGRHTSQIHSEVAQMSSIVVYLEQCDSRLVCRHVFKSTVNVRTMQIWGIWKLRPA